jgi:hypothetical protein
MAGGTPLPRLCLHGLPVADRGGRVVDIVDDAVVDLVWFQNYKHAPRTGLPPRPAERYARSSGGHPTAPGPPIAPRGSWGPSRACRTGGHGDVRAAVVMLLGSRLGTEKIAR